MKLYKMPLWGKKRAVRLRIASYVNNGNLAIAVECRKKLFFWEEGPVLTVNLGTQLDETIAYIDTNNLGEEVLPWLESTGLAIPTEWSERSGFCLYPQVMFDRDRLMKADPEGYQAHIEQWERRSQGPCAEQE